MLPLDGGHFVTEIPGNKQFNTQNVVYVGGFLMKKLLAVVLTLALLILCSVIVFADAVLSSSDTVLSGLNEDSVRQAVTRYFSQRETNY